MKIAVFYEETDLAFSKDIHKLVAAFDSGALLLNIDNDCSTISDILHSLTNDLTHIVLVINNESLHNVCSTFILGAMLFKEQQHILVSGKEVSVLAGFRKNYNYCVGIGPFKALLSDENTRYEKQQRIENAVQKLHVWGYSKSKESMTEAVVLGDYAAVEQFLDAGFSPSSRAIKKVPYLTLAVRNLHKKIMKLLIDKGASVNTLSSDNGNSLLMEAVYKGDDEIVNSLIEHGADLNIVNKNGQTALMIAIGAGHEGITGLLLRSGADAAIADLLGMTALQYAELFHKENIIKMIKHALPKGDK